MNRLGQSEETFRILAECVPVMVWSARSDGFIEYFNPHALAFMGLPVEELCGWGWRKLIHPDDVPRAQTAWEQAFRSGKPYTAHHRVQRNDGLYYWVAARGQPVSTQDGQVERWIGTFVEIQGQRHATEDPVLHVDSVAFRDNLQDNTRQELAIQTPDMGVFDCDLITGAVNFSPGYKRQLGYQDEEFANNLHEMDIRLHPEDRERVTQSLHTYLADPRPFCQSQYRVRHKDGDYRWMLVRVELIRDVSGRPCRVLVCQLDLTERNRALVDRLLKAREEEATRIARELHDQFGRYLTTIKMDVRSIERDLARELTLDVVGILREKAQTIGQTVDETVQTVRAIATQLRPGLLDDLGLAAAIEWQAKDFQKRSGILCALTLPEGDPRLSRDQATAIFRIFQEILTNVARHAEATKVWVHLGEEQEAIVLEVEDNGVGISPTQLAERRSLGLLGMRERAGAFGGAVEIVGSQGHGTTVIVQMPLLKTNDENLDR